MNWIWRILYPNINQRKSSHILLVTVIVLLQGMKWVKRLLSLCYMSTFVLYLTFFTRLSCQRCGLWHRTRRGLRARTLCVGHLGLCGPPPGRHSSAGSALEVPPTSLRPWQTAAVRLRVPQHSGCAEAGQHQQRQQRLRPQWCCLSYPGLWQHDLPSLWAREQRLWASCVYSSRDNAPEPNQHLLQSLMILSQNSGNHFSRCGNCLQVNTFMDAAVKCGKFICESYLFLSSNLKKTAVLSFIHNAVVAQIVI